MLFFYVFFVFLRILNIICISEEMRRSVENSLFF
jgi:hypothetical protein